MGLADFLKKILDSKTSSKRKSSKKSKTSPLRNKSSSKREVKKTIKKSPKRVKTPALSKVSPKEKEIGCITHYFGKISVGIIKLKAEMKVGDKIHIKGVHDDFVQVIKSMQENHKDILKAKKGALVGIKVKKIVHVNDKVYRV